MSRRKRKAFRNFKPDWTSTGICRDCGSNRTIPHSELENVEVPRCTNCGGILDVKLKMEKGKVKRQSKRTR